MINGSPLVSIITINYNQYKITCDFLRSLEKLTYRNFEVIVIDNASVEDHSDALKKEFPFIKLFRTKRNLGFTGGNNLGMRLSLGDFVFIVNNDTEVADINLLEKLVEPFAVDGKIGMVSPKIRFFSKPDTIQYAGYEKINPITGRNSQIGEGELDKGQYDTSGFTNYAHGAAMMVSREVMEKIGILTDHFFLCYEELDWSAQAIQHGYKVFYQAKVSILHKESITMGGKTSPMKVYYNNRNRIMFMRRNTNVYLFSCFLLYFTFFTIPKNVMSFILRSEWQHLQSFMRAIGWNIRNFNIYKKTSFHTLLTDVSLDVIEK